MRMFKGPSGSGSEELQFPQAVSYPTSGIRSSAIVAITCNKEIVTGGHADNSIRLISVDGAKTLEIARGHCAPVTCLALSPDGNHLVTGSRDATVLLWRLHRVSSADPSTGSSAPASASSTSKPNILVEKGRRHRIEGPMHVLRGHLGEIVCCAVSSDLGIVVSCSRSSDVLLHTTRRGRLIRRLVGVEADAVCLSSDGIIIVWNKSLGSLSTFTLNGAFIAKSQLPVSLSLSCMEISVDGRCALVGLNPSLENDSSFDSSRTLKMSQVGIGNFDSETNDDEIFNASVPSICFFDIYSLKMLHVMKLGVGQDIMALALNKDNTNLILSTADKQLIIFTDPTLSLKVVDQMLKLGWEGEGLSPLIK